MGKTQLATYPRTPPPLHTQIKVKAETESNEDSSAYLRPSPSPIFSIRSPLASGNPSSKLTKTEQKGSGAKKRNAAHQQLAIIKTDRPVSFPVQVPVGRIHCPLFLEGRATRAWPCLLSARPNLPTRAGALVRSAVS